MIKVTYTTTHSFTREDLTQLIENALDTGYIGYWCEEGGLLPNGDYEIVEIDESGDDDAVNPRHLITPAGLEKGIRLMANEQPGHFADLVANNYDAETCDVFVQMCIFGDIIYG